MSGDIQGFIADWLHTRGLQDEDGFGKKVALALSSLESWNAGQIRKVLNKTKTDLFRRNTGPRKSEVCGELTESILETFEAPRPAIKRCQILFFAANPTATSRLSLEEEARTITEKIRAAKFRDAIELTTAWAVRPDDLLQYLNERDPTIVHFSGHGGGVTGLVLQRDSGDAILVKARALRELFKNFKGKVRLVVLNACYSQVQAKAIAKEIDCVVGMRVSIGDEAARVFAASLYRAIAFGRSIKEAFDQGKTALRLQGIPEADTPILISRKGVHPSKVYLT